VAKRIRCRHCHEYIDEEDYPRHVERHQKLKPDGQHTDYVTLPPEAREAGSLEGVPKVYVHRACGARTGMPEEIIRSYLQNPYLYSADATFCVGCHRHVPLRECVWVETGEDLQRYTDKLRAAKPECKPAGWESRGQPPPRPRKRPKALVRRRRQPQGCLGPMLLIALAALCIVGAE
jgi:hypothetical protein